MKERDVMFEANELHSDVHVSRSVVVLVTCSFTVDLKVQQVEQKPGGRVVFEDPVCI